MSFLTTNIQQKTNAAGQREVTLGLEGALDSSTVASFEAELTTILTGKPAHLIFDLAGLKFVASAGIRLFFRAVQEQKQSGGFASFLHLQPQIKEVFDIMDNLPDVKIFRDQSELDAYLLARQKTHLEWQKSQRQ